MASKIENTEEGELYRFAKQSIAANKKLCIKSNFSSFEESSHKGSSEYCTYLIDY